MIQVQLKLPATTDPLGILTQPCRKMPVSALQPAFCGVLALFHRLFLSTHVKIQLGREPDMDRMLCGMHLPTLRSIGIGALAAALVCVNEVQQGQLGGCKHLAAQAAHAALAVAGS